MRIDPNAKVANLPESKSGSRSNAVRLPALESPGEDVATFASNTRVQQLEKQAAQLSESQADRIEALTRAVRSGEYRLDPEKIAQALFMEMSARSVLMR